MKERVILSAAVLALLIGCGEGASNFEAVSPLAAPTEVEIYGNLAANPEAASILVFAFADLARDGSPADGEPLTVTSMEARGRMALSVPPVDSLTLVFLADESHDGVIDDGDLAAVLADPDQLLTGLRAGDRVGLVDLELDFGARRAVAASIEVERAAEPGPAATPTPEA